MTHVGELGAGHTIKVLNNLVSATTFAITAEALSIGIKKGLSPSKMLEVINHSTGRNNSSENKFPQHVLTRKFDVGFAMDLMCKDLTIATDIIRNEKMPAFVSDTVYQLWQYAQSKSEKGADHSVYAKLIEEMSGLEIKD
nr:NAD-binding protein [Lentibacillus halodurans]